jgi:hypothetical protein
LVTFDTLRFARRLRESGVSEQQAEVQAELMAEAFGFYIDDLVTRDHLDARLADLERGLERRFSRVDRTLSLHSWIIAITAAGVLLPQIRSFLT